MTSRMLHELPSKAYGVLEWLNGQAGNPTIGLPSGAAQLTDNPQHYTDEGKELLRVLDRCGYVKVKMIGVATERGDGDGRSPWHSPSRQVDSEQSADDPVWNPKRGVSWPTWDGIIQFARTVSEGLATPDPQLKENQEKWFRAALLATAPVIRITEAGRNALATRHLEVEKKHKRKRKPPEGRKLLTEMIRNHVNEHEKAHG